MKENMGAILPTIALYIPLPPPQTTLGEIRQSIAGYTHLDLGAFKLIHSGAVMKGDSFPITAHGIRAGSTIQIVGSASPIPGRRSSSISSSSGRESKVKARPTEQTTIKVIHDEMSQVRQKLLPSLQALHAALMDGAVLDKEVLKQEHTRLGEMLLQSLLRLDALSPESEWVDARKERKTAVKEVQGLLDQLDAAWKAR
ncbi:hypothetical protein FRB97_002326 [Tulasnella sp. 331]|nr:hypothetical protein FRB97_002326 [Tulasnella sp. 331]